MTRHYIATAGLHGYMPSCIFSTSTIGAAAESLGSIHDSSWVTNQLRRYHYVELSMERHGNEYASIEACYCDNPDNHNDD